MWYNEFMSREINLYAARVFGEHPIATWTLDNVTANESVQYFSDENPAIVEEGFTTGLPLVYGSSQSLGITADSTGVIIQVEDRLWEQVRTYSNTGFVVNWQFWYDQNITFGELMQEERFVVELGQASVKYPGYGMFTNGGKYNSYTSEFWMRINPRVTQPRKIWGTLTTLDGIWVNDNYITLTVGGKYKSYAIENWFRPMLVNVTYNSKQARLLINGVEVISLDLNPDEFDFDILDETLVAEEGYLGFMGYPNIETYEVDAVSLFPYIVPDAVCKRRFVWGQGLSDAASFSTFFENSTTYVDWSFADYTSNAIYPDVFNWDTGYLSGLVTNRGAIQTPSYSLPEIFIQGRQLKNLYKENLFNNESDNVNPGFSFKPEYDWTQNSYFYFDTIEKLQTAPQIIYGVFSKHWFEVSEDPQTLFRFAKRYSDDTVEIIITGNTVTYYYNDTVKETFTVVDDSLFTVGFDLNNIVKLDADFRNFFFNISDIEVYVGGNGTNTFSGLIYRIGFSDTAMCARDELIQYFPNGIAAINYNMSSQNGSYVIRPFIRYGEFYLDVEAGGYWEDAIPLSYFGRNFQNEDGSYSSNLEFFQMNIGYDGMYSISDNKYISESEMKCFITFQPLVSSSDAPLRNFTTTQNLPVNRIIDASQKTGLELADTKFEWINGTVVVPPANYDNWKVVIYFVVNAEGVMSSPFQVKNLSISSQAYKDEAAVGTRFGNKITSTDRFAIYKENTPYLYLTKDSGVEPLDGPVMSPVNPNGNYPYLVGNLNMFIKPNLLLDEANTLFTIRSRYGTMNLTYNGTGWHLRKEGDLPLEYVTLYQNGVEVTEFDLVQDKWTMIGIEFGEPLDFALVDDLGIELNIGAVYQNISVSALSETQVESTAIVRTWEGVKIQTWQNWLDDPSVETFADLVSSRAYLQYPVDPTQIYRIFTGGNSTSVGTTDPNLSIGGMNMTMATGVEWTTFDRRPT